MVDWPGLLKWTLAHQDGTKEANSNNIKPLDQETQKWLTEALEEYQFNEVKRMKEIMDEVTTLSKSGNDNDKDKIIALMEEFTDLVEGLENSRDLVKAGYWPKLVEFMFNTKYPEVRKTLYMIFQSCNSNNEFVQLASMQVGAFGLINKVLNETDMRNKEGALSALSSIIRGECFEVKRQFIECEGIEFLVEILKNEQKYPSKKLKTKAISMLSDLVYYDNKLNYKNIQDANNSGYKFAQQANAKTNLHMGSGKEESKSSGSAKLEYAKYKDFVKKSLIKDCFIMIGAQFLDGNKLREYVDIRPAFFRILVELAKFNKTAVQQQIDVKALIKFSSLLKSKNKEYDDLFDSEIAVLDQLVATPKY